MRVRATELTMRGGFILGVVYLLSVLLTARAAKSYAKAICERRPIHTTAQQTKGNNGFRIYVEGVPTEGKYRPGASYTGESRSSGACCVSYSTLSYVALYSEYFIIIILLVIQGYHASRNVQDIQII